MGLPHQVEHCFLQGILGLRGPAACVEQQGRSMLFVNPLYQSNINGIGPPLPSPLLCLILTYHRSEQSIRRNNEISCCLQIRLQRDATSIRYLLSVTAIVAICLGILLIPLPREETINYYGSAPEPARLPDQPFAMQHFLVLLPIRCLAFLGSVTLTLHTIARVLGLNTVAKWLFAILIPTVADAAWHWYSVNELGYRSSLSIGDHIEMGLIGNAIAFACLTGLLAAPAWLRTKAGLAVSG